MSKLLPFTDAINIAIVPVVTPENKAKWEAYSVANDYWVNENMRVQEDWGRYYGPIVYNGSHNGVVHGDYGDIPDNVRYVENRALLRPKSLSSCGLTVNLIP